MYRIFYTTTLALGLVITFATTAAAQVEIYLGQGRLVRTSCGRLEGEFWVPGTPKELACVSDCVLKDEEGQRVHDYFCTELHGTPYYDENQCIKAMDLLYVPCEEKCCTPDDEEKKEFA